MAVKNKYYVVWKGHKTGIFNSWNECKKQVEGYEYARYKGFPSLAEAQKAFQGRYEDYVGKVAKTPSLSPAELALIGKPTVPSIAVDAACSGNPGKMEYRGVDVRTGQQLFHVGPLDDGTNNIGEFLAIVHALALLKRDNSLLPIYSDSKIAMGWIRQKHCKTKLEETSRNEKLFELIDRAETWLHGNTYTNRILKWETKAWGEIPADFGRK
ncbi:MAG: ribonuclease H family protein [Capnocytophaga sp.]|nr:ribonuclease H family protein [Capnocytophaga sp.]